MTQELCLNHGGGSAREAMYKHGVTCDSMETDSAEKHSYAGHDCANCKSLCTKNALKCHTWELWDKGQIQRWLLLCGSANAAPDPAMDSQVWPEGGGKKVTFLAICCRAEEKPLSKVIKISRFCQPISTYPRTHSDKQAHPLCSKERAGFPWAMPGLMGFATLTNTDTGLWWRMVQEMPVTAPLPLLPSLAF